VETNTRMQLLAVSLVCCTWQDFYAVCQSAVTGCC